MQVMSRATLEQARLGTTSAETIDTLLGTAPTAHSLHDLVQSHIFLQTAREHKVLQVIALALITAQGILSLWYLLHNRITAIVLSNFIIPLDQTVLQLVEVFLIILAGRTTRCILISQPVVMLIKEHSTLLDFQTCVTLGYGHLEVDCMIDAFL